MEDETDCEPTPDEAQELLRRAGVTPDAGSRPFEFGPGMTAEELIAWLEQSGAGLH